jgi:tetratricopeptide (TPR) repeat protein
MYKKVILIVFAILVVCSAIYALMDHRPVTTSSAQAYKAYQKGFEYMNKLYAKEALQEFERAVDLDPQFAMAHLRAATLYWESDKKDKYEESRQKALALIDKVKDIERLQILLAFAKIDRNEKDTEKYAAELMKRYPDHFESVLYESGKYFGEKKYEEAARANLHLIEIAPDYALGYNQLGYIYFYLGEFEKSREYLEKYAEIADDQANPHDSRGEILMNMGFYDEALGQFQIADSIKPGLHFVVSHMGDVYAAKGMYREAIGAFMKAKELARNRVIQVDQIIRLAECYYYMDKPRESIAVVEEAARETPDNITLQAYLGYYYSRTGEIEKALVQLGVVKGIATGSSWEVSPYPDSVGRDSPPGIQLALEARIAADRGNYDDAIESYQQLLKQLLPFNSSGIWRRMADVYIAAGKPDSAITFLNKALEWNPNNTLVLRSLARAYKARGMWNEQSETLQKVLEVLRNADSNLNMVQEARTELSVLDKKIS